MAAAERTRAGLAAGVVALSLDQRERQRVRETVASSARLLGRSTSEEELGAAAVAELLSALEAELTEEQARADERARAAHEQQLERLRTRFRQRREAFGRVEGGVGRLREITSPPAILDAAPQRLCESSGFDRVLLSTVTGGRLVAVAAHFEDDPEAATAALERLAEQPIELEHPLLEAEVLRRRRATAVTDARLNPRTSPALSEAMGWSAYVVAPVVIQGRVIAVLHADRRDGRLDVLHRDILWRFAVGLAQAYESASLRRRLRREREYMRRFLDRLDARLAQLSDSAVQFAPPAAARVGAPDPAAPAPCGRATPSRESSPVAKSRSSSCSPKDSATGRSPTGW